MPNVIAPEASNTIITVVNPLSEIPAQQPMNPARISNKYKTKPIIENISTAIKYLLVFISLPPFFLIYINILIFYQFY
jgi:hypothetical protein